MNVVGPSVRVTEPVAPLVTVTVTKNVVNAVAGLAEEERLTVEALSTLC